MSAQMPQEPAVIAGQLEVVTELASVSFFEAESSTTASKRKQTSKQDPKRASKQNRTETKGKQAKLAFGNGQPILRVSDDEDFIATGESSKPKKPRKKLKDGGEEAERKAMAARNRAMKKVEADEKRAGARKAAKGKGRAAQNGADDAITLLSSSPIREASPPCPSSKRGSRASSSSDTVIITECSGGPVSIVLDSDDDEPGPSNKRKHPFFVRKNASGGADDPIMLGEDWQRKPAKMMRVTDSRPAHSFFSAKTSGASTPMERQVSDSLTAGKKKAKKEHAFFAPLAQGAAADQPVATQAGWGQDVKEGHEWFAPWPGSEGHQVWPDFCKANTAPTRKGKESEYRAADYWLDYLEQITHPALRRSVKTTSISSDVIPFITAHPAFRSIPTRTSTSTDWAHKYAPQAAAQVFGNEKEVIYLRDWILALEVGVSNPVAQPVIRNVTRRPRRQAGESWIDYDDEPVRGNSDDEDLESVNESLPLFDRSSGAMIYPPLTRLTNTIVLTGPSGSGKTAAVYAAAHELGWDVFEVFPGIGKRNASSLTALVGEVSRNHMVVMNGRAEAKAGTSGSAIDLTEEKSGGTAERKEAPAKARQSVILLEEVDILYEEDRTFWQAVVTLISESRRPVILTCNDLSLVPCSQLPLQSILHFQAISTFIALPYLDAIAANEGLASTASAYTRHSHTALNLHHPLPPRNSQEASQFDLRQAIHQLQLGIGQQLESPEIIEETSDLQAAVTALDHVSFADAWIEQRPSAAMEALETDVYGPSLNDEIGQSLLYKVAPDSLSPTLPSSSRQNEIVGFLGYGKDDERLRRLATDRAEYITSTLSFLDELVALDGYLLPHESLFLDVIPFVRSIVNADDALEAADRAAAANGEDRTNRRTGRPMRITTVLPGRAEYTRYFDLPVEGLTQARRQMFM